MKVHMLTTADGRHISYDSRDYERLREMAKKDRFGRHFLTDNPEDAELILFVNSAEPNLVDVTTHIFTKKYRERVFLHHTGDTIFPWLPGIYPSIDRRWRKFSRTKSGAYPRVVLDQAIEDFSGLSDPEHVFSFVGAIENHPIRRKFLRIADRGGLIVDTSGGASYQGGDRVARYVRSLRESVFILCPRGGGASSFRLFETMKAGRIPVIISDRWEPPSGIDWPTFSLRVSEAEVQRIPELLDSLLPRAQEMCSIARQTWEQWFSPETYFHRVIEWCCEILRERTVAEKYARPLIAAQLLRREYFRSYVLARIIR